MEYSISYEDSQDTAEDTSEDTIEDTFEDIVGEETLHAEVKAGERTSIFYGDPLSVEKMPGKKQRYTREDHLKMSLREAFEKYKKYDQSMYEAASYILKIPNVEFYNPNLLVIAYMFIQTHSFEDINSFYKSQNDVSKEDFVRYVRFMKSVEEKSRKSKK